MIKKHNNKSITWVEVESPTLDEIRSLSDDYGVSMNIAMELELPTYKEKIIAFKDYLYMVMHFPALRHSHSSTEQEIDFIVGKNFIITTRYETIDALERFSKTFEVNSMLEKDLMEDHAGYVLYYIIKELYKCMSDELESVNDSLKLIEKNIFRGREKEMVIEISKMNRNLMNVEHIIFSQNEILQRLKEHTEKLFGKAFSNNMDKIINEYYRVQKILTSNMDFLKELRDTNDSMLSYKQNETMRVLMVITLLAAPFSIITGFFQLNGLSIKNIVTNHNWQVVVGVEIIVLVVSFMFMKIRKWL